MTFLESFLSALSFFFLCVVVALAPWLFGAWEMCWFWPFAVALFFATLLFALRLCVCRAQLPQGNSGRNRLLAWTALSCLPFLAYAFVRALQADVYMDAERGFLLVFMPVLVAFQVLLGCGKRQLRFLSFLIIVDLYALGLYGILNHVFFKSAWVMWKQGYAQYLIENRATGSYFCPDHFAGIMEIAFCLALGILMTRGTGLRRKIAVLPLAAIGVVGVVLSKSRGGGLTLLVVMVAAMIWGLAQWRPAVRWRLRGGMMLLLLAAILVLWSSNSSYSMRFRSYFIKDNIDGRSSREIVDDVAAHVEKTTRYQMVSGALRAWKMSPWFGIGPGMHKHLWFFFAASEDGDRESGKWPTHVNRHFHSYVVHSDWVQLLEEYGVVGFFLFMLPTTLVLMTMLRGIRDESRICKAAGWQALGMTDRDYSILVGIIFTAVALAFHSLGDFNLRMPATGWLMGALVGIGISISIRKAICVEIEKGED